MLDLLANAQLCGNTNPKDIQYKCSPLKGEKRWWTYDEDKEKAGMCGRSAPLYKGYYPLCDPDDPGYSCCGIHGYCGTGPEFCTCDGCVDFASSPDLLVKKPVKLDLSQYKVLLFRFSFGLLALKCRFSPKNEI